MELFNHTVLEPHTYQKVLKGFFSNPQVQELLLVGNRTLTLLGLPTPDSKLEIIAQHDLFAVIVNAKLFLSPSKKSSMTIVLLQGGKLKILGVTKKLTEYFSADIFKIHNQDQDITLHISAFHLAVEPSGRYLAVAPTSSSILIFEVLECTDSIKIQKLHNIYMPYQVIFDISFLLRNTGSTSINSIQLYAITAQMEQVQKERKPGRTLKIYHVDEGQILPNEAIVFSEQQFIYRLIPTKKEVLFILSTENIWFFSSMKWQSLKIPRRSGHQNVNFTCEAEDERGRLFMVSEYGDIIEVEYSTRLARYIEIEQIKLVYSGTISHSNDFIHIEGKQFFSLSQRSSHCLYEMKENKKRTSKRKENEFRRTKSTKEELMQFRVGQEHNSYQFIVVDRLHSEGMINDCVVVIDAYHRREIAFTNFGEEGQNYLSFIKKGVKVKEENSIKYMNIPKMWLVKEEVQSPVHKYLFLSFINKTIVYQISQKSLIAKNDVLIEEGVNSLLITRLADKSLIQVQIQKIRQIRKDKTVHIIHCKARVDRAVARSKQIIIAMQGGYLSYYQLDRFESIKMIKEIILESSEAEDLKLSPLNKKNGKSSYLAVAKTNYTIAIYSLKEDRILSLAYEFSYKGQFESMSFSFRTFNAVTCFVLGIGSKTGDYTEFEIYTEKDKEIRETAKQKLGNSPVKIIKMNINNSDASLLSSDQNYLTYKNKKGQYKNTILSCPRILSGMQLLLGFNSVMLVAYCQGHLKVFELQNIGEEYYTQRVALTYSGKKIVQHKETLGIIESSRTIKGSEAPARIWKSQFSLYRLGDEKIASEIHLEDNWVCISACFHTLKTKKETACILLLGCAKAVHFYPELKRQSHVLKAFLWNEQTFKYQFLYSQDMEDLPTVLMSWKSFLLAGVGGNLVLYEPNKSKVVKIAQLKNVGVLVSHIKTEGDKIYVLETMGSCKIIRYLPYPDCILRLVAEDAFQKYPSSVEVVGKSGLVVVADKFGNIFFNKMTKNAEEQFENMSKTTKNIFAEDHSLGFELMTAFHLGEVVVKIHAHQKSDKDTVIIYATNIGRIGVLRPFNSYPEAVMCFTLQRQLQQLPSLGFGNHRAFRNYFVSSEGIADGDLCQKYQELDTETKDSIAKEIKDSPSNILHKYHQMILNIF